MITPFQEGPPVKEVEYIKDLAFVSKHEHVKIAENLTKHADVHFAKMKSHFFVLIFPHDTTIGWKIYWDKISLKRKLLPMPGGGSKVGYIFSLNRGKNLDYLNLRIHVINELLVFQPKYDHNGDLTSIAQTNTHRKLATRLRNKLAIDYPQAKLYMEYPCKSLPGPADIYIENFLRNDWKIVIAINSLAYHHDKINRDLKQIRDLLQEQTLTYTLYIGYQLFHPLSLAIDITENTANCADTIYDDLKKIRDENNYSKIFKEYVTNSVMFPI